MQQQLHDRAVFICIPREDAGYLCDPPWRGFDLVPKLRNSNFLDLYVTWKCSGNIPECQLYSLSNDTWILLTNATKDGGHYRKYPAHSPIHRACAMRVALYIADKPNKMGLPSCPPSISILRRVSKLDLAAYIQIIFVQVVCLHATAWILRGACSFGTASLIALVHN